MKTTVFAVSAMLLAASTTVSAAQADGPRASSGTGWPGISQPAPHDTSADAPRYVWQEGYDHGGKWRGHWVLVQ